MMRVAFVAGALPLGGSTTYTLFLADALKKAGLAAEVFSFSADHPLKADFSSMGVEVHKEDDTRLIYEDRLQSLYSKVRAFQPAAVFAILGAQSFELLRYLPKGVSRIGVFHDPLSPPFNFATRYEHFLDHLVVVAPYLREVFSKVAPELPCTYLAHGVLLSSAAPRIPNPNGPLRLLYYGRLENVSKGVRIFPKIVDALKRKRIPFVWTIHGKGPEEQFLRDALMPDLKKGYICFSKPTDLRNLPEIIRNHDIYLLASNNEGGPLTLLESMALGLVPVCGDIPCLIQEVITTENGFRVPRDNPDAYAEAVFKLHKDRRLLEAMSQEAKKTMACNFSAESMAKRYITFLQTLPTAAKCPVWLKQIQPQPILGQSKLRNCVLTRKVRRLIKGLSF